MASMLEGKPVDFETRGGRLFAVFANGRKRAQLAAADGDAGEARRLVAEESSALGEIVREAIADALPAQGGGE